MKKIIDMIYRQEGAKRVLAVAILVAALPALVWGTMQVKRWLSRAAGPTVGLAFSPSSDTLPPDKTLGIVVEAGTEKISGAHVEFTFDQTKVQLAGEVQVTGALTQVLVKTTAAEANSTGRVKLAVGLPLGSAGQGPSGNVELARVTFRANTAANTTANVNYDGSKVEIVNDAATILTVNPRGATLTLNSGGGARVFFSPASASMPPNKTLGVMVDSGAEKVGFVQVEFTFNPAKVQLASEVQVTGPLTTVLAKTTKAQANSTGRVRIALGLPLVVPPAPTPVPASGTFEIAQVTLTAVSSVNNDSASLDYDTGQLQVVTVGEQALSVSATGATLSLNPGGTPTRTPTPRRTPTPTSRRTPTPTPRRTPTPTPIRTPTPTPIRTPTPTPIRTPTPTGTQCLQVITPARCIDITKCALNQCQTFPTSCLPDGWVADPSCAVTLTPTVVVDSFSFKVRLQGITQKAGNQAAAMVFKQNGQEVRSAGSVMVNDNTGVYLGQLLGFEAPGPLPDGTYDVFIKTPSHLQRRIDGVIITAPPQTVDWSTDERKQLLVGDVNGTNTITIEDIAAVLAKYTDFVVSVPPGTPEDVNADGRITIDDVALTLINYTDFTVSGDQ